MTTDNDDKPASDEVERVRVRAVAGALVRDEVTGQPIEGEVEVPRTRQIERRIAQGDLEEVGAQQEAPAPEPEPTPGNNAAQGDLEKEQI